MSASKYQPPVSREPEWKGPPGPLFFPPRNMDTSRIQRKCLDLTYGDESPIQSLDIYLPDEGDGPFPVVVLFHGGAWMFGDKGDLQHLPMMAARECNYAVMCAGYPLSGEAKFPSQIRDCKAAIRFVRANAAKHHLDPQRIAAWGPSAGGHLAALVGTSPTVRELDDPTSVNAGVSCRVQAVVDWCGPTESFLKIDEEFLQCGRGAPDHSEEDSPESRLLGVKITEVPEWVRMASPMTHITAEVPPFLVQHGELDPIVPVQQSVEFAAAITRIAGPERVTLEILPGVHHHGDPAFETDENIQRVLDFLDLHLKYRGTKGDGNPLPNQPRFSQS